MMVNLSITCSIARYGGFYDHIELFVIFLVQVVEEGLVDNAWLKKVFLQFASRHWGVDDVKQDIFVIRINDGE